MVKDKFVSVLMGSDSDLPVMQVCIDLLREYDIVVEAKITSAHRTPEMTRNYVEDAQARGAEAFICGAGMAAHLAGSVAALTTKPVLGVPLNASLNGLDALLSTVQMPAGIPVATFAIGKAGAKNAAFFCLQMLAMSDERIAQALKDQRQEQIKVIQQKDAALQQELLQVF